MERPRRTQRLDRGIKGWIVNQARKNYWRVAGWYELDDLIQDAYMCYAKCNQRYPMNLEQRHFMSLVARTFQNHCHTLAARRAQQLDAPVTTRTRQWKADRLSDPDAVLQRAADAYGQPEEQTFAALMSSLAPELRELIRILLEDARELPMLRPSDARDHEGKFRRREMETRNDYFCRIAGLPSGFDVEAALRAHFGT